MTRMLLATAALLLAASTAAQSQMPPTNFDQAAYVTCREAQNMQPEARKTLAVYLAEHSSRYRGGVIPEGDQGAHLALLVRGGCTLAPDAYLFTVIDRAILSELPRLPKRR
jgi:hypothetical protein